jgi:hypothetical protein
MRLNEKVDPPRLARPRRMEKLSSRVRFLRQRYVELLEHLGRPPSAPERILIERIGEVEWGIRWLDAQIEAEPDGRFKLGLMRERTAATTQLRASLAALGLMPGRRARQMTGERKRAAAESWQDVMAAVRSEAD